MNKGYKLLMLIVPSLLLACVAIMQCTTIHTSRAAASDTDVHCKTAHVEIVKRLQPDDDHVLARYIMNKHFCYDGTKVVSSDNADVRGYVRSLWSSVYEFKGNVSTQNGSSKNGNSTAMGNFTVKTNINIPLIKRFGISLFDLGQWQPNVTIMPHGDGGFDYAPSSAATSTDIVYAYFV